LDEHSDAGAIVRRWQKAGCDPRNVAVAVHRYVAGYTTKLNAQREERKKRTSTTLKDASRSLGDLEKLYRDHDQVDAANRIAGEIGIVQETSSRIPSAFNTKRLGVSRSWTDLAMIEGFVFEATQQRPTPKELVSLIKAGRQAAGQTADSWEINTVNIRKGLKTFKKNNPLQSWFWTSPSRPL
jgi:hypothetical protein